MIKNLFDLSYETDSNEAFIFYFLYTILGYSLLLWSFSLLLLIGKLLPPPHFSEPPLFLDYIVSLPFILALFFYPYIAVRITYKKKLKDLHSINLVILSIILTIYIPIVFSKNIGLLSAFIGWIFPGMILGGIPVAILTTKEDLSLSKEIQQMEQEKLEHEQWIEKQLLSEQITRMKQDERNKQKNEYDEE